MNPWTLAYEGFEPEREGLREALCALGNGYFVTRGASAENDAGDVHYPGTYLAGGYNRLKTDIAGHVIENEDLVNIPNWLPLTFRIAGGNWFNPLGVDILEWRQELDLARGVLIRSVRFRDREGRTTLLRHRRLVHMRQPHLAALETTLTPEDWSGSVEFRTALDGRVVNAGVKRYASLNNKHLLPIEASAINGEALFLKVQTTQSEIRIAQAARTRAFVDGQAVSSGRTLIEEPGYIGQKFTIRAERGREIRIEKVLAMYTSRDGAIAECGLEACKWIERTGGFEDLLAGHEFAWKHLWNRFDIEVEPQDKAANNRVQLILRLHIFHLLQTTSMHRMHIDAGVPARGWHGEAYRGHIFWDELFIFPLLNLRAPRITRSLLIYRYGRLNEARANAKQEGYTGAMYPWQSGSDGREESQRIHLNPKSGRWIPDNSRRQRHVSAAIAYNIWQYFQVSGDIDFLADYGAEMLLEIARFWASISVYNESLGRYEIAGVMGPDEYHDNYPGVEDGGLRNNAYTNIMAVWVICRALEVIEMLPADRSSELRESLCVSDEEIARWRDITRKMRVVFHGDGIISQFEGYEKLEELDWEHYRAKYGNIARLDRILEAEGDTPNRYKASKQADVLMLFYLFSAEELGQLFGQLGYAFDRGTIPRNIDYYLKRTSHGSTLSGVVHSWVLARSDRARAWQLFETAIEADISDVQGGTTPEGIHLGAMAGTVDLVQRGQTGLVTREGVLWLNPCLPDDWAAVRMRVRYREHLLALEVERKRVVVRSIGGPRYPILIGYRDQQRELRLGGTVEFELGTVECHS